MMRDDNNDGQMIFGDLGGIKLPDMSRGIRRNMGIWAKLNINVEIVRANFVFSQIAVGTI